MQKLIVVVGMPGSGKGACVDYFESKGYKKIHFGNMVYEEVERRGLNIVENEREVREDMRLQEGKEVLAKRAHQKIQCDYSGEPVVVLDGVYSWSEYKFLKDIYNDTMTTIAVFTNKALRYERIVNRDDVRRRYKLEDVVSRDQEEIENLEKGGPIAAADYTVLNNASLAQLTAELDKLMEEII